MQKLSFGCSTSFRLSRKLMKGCRPMPCRSYAGVRKSLSTGLRPFALINRMTKKKRTSRKKTGWKDSKMKIAKTVFGWVGKLCLGFIGLVAWIGKRVL